MKRLIEFFVRNHLFADILSIVVVVFGIYAVSNIRRETFPNVKFDTLTVTTIFPGATPEEVEKLITSPIEQDLKEVDGVKKLQSNSVEGRSEIFILLDPDQTTEEEAKSDVKDVIDKLTSLPEAAEEPKVLVIETKTEPIIEVALYGQISDLELREVAKKLERQIETVAGVARVSWRGERDLEIRVEADQKKLQQYRVTLDEVINALKAQNVSVPAGSFEGEKTEKIVRVIGDFTTLKDIEDTVVRANDLAQALRIRDLATVSYDLEKASLLNRVNGIQSISLSVEKKMSADAIDVVDLVKAKIAAIKPSIDSRLQIEYVNDFSYYIRNRLGIVTSNLLLGLLCVLFLLPFFLPIRFAFLVAIGEPFALLGAILVLYWTGQSINLISMIGLIIVSGILVDDSIVVTENAVRRIEDGEDPKLAAVNGTMQIFGPLTASVATTGVVFLPMAFMSGIFGKFVFEIPLAVLTCLLVSLFETYFILPAHIAHWIKGKTETVKRQNFFARASAASNRYWSEKVEPAYAKVLTYFIRRRYLVLSLVGVFFLTSVYAGYLYVQKRFILFPPDGVELFFVRTEAPNGTSLNTHAELLKPLEAIVAQLPKTEMMSFVTNVGIQQQDPTDPFTRRGSEFAQIVVYLTPENKRDRSAEKIIEYLRERIGKPAEFLAVNFDRANTGPPTGKAVSLGVRGQEFSQIIPVVQELKDMLKKIQGVTDINDSHVLGKEEVLLRVDQEKAAAAGVSVASAGFTTRAAFEGFVATSVRTLSEEQKVRVFLQRNQVKDEQVLDKIQIPNAAGNLIPLREVTTVDRGQGPLVISHEANQRQINVTASVDTQITSSLAVNGQLRDLLPQLNERHKDVTIAFGGEDEDTNESFASLGRTFLVALAGVYLILVLTFGNLHQPFIVMLTVPLGLVSVLWAFILHGLPISFMGCLGAVALVGVIVNNAIVLVDFINQHHRENQNLHDAIIFAARDRLRPIFLTTITTVIGVMPTAYGIGGLDMFIVPIAMSLLWGLIFGALLTAFVFPPAMATLEELRGFIGRIFRAPTVLNYDR